MARVVVAVLAVLVLLIAIPAVAVRAGADTLVVAGVLAVLVLGNCRSANELPSSFTTARSCR